eukprot:scaffold55060_cov62-Phaeocystis_antarctica.AAC.6
MAHAECLHIIADVNHDRAEEPQKDAKAHEEGVLQRSLRRRRIRRRGVAPFRPHRSPKRVLPASPLVARRLPHKIISIHLQNHPHIFTLRCQANSGGDEPAKTPRRAPRQKAAGWRLDSVGQL